MQQTSSLKSRFLIAMPGFEDPHFSRTVTYICEHDQNGAMGIVVNRPTSLHLTDIFQHMDISGPPGHATNQLVFSGGPVQEQRGFVLHTDKKTWESTLQVTDDLFITTSRDILEAIAQNEGPERSLIALGYAGWSAGQLEQELTSDAWLAGPAESKIIFDTPTEDRWTAAASLMGVDLNLITTHAGHG